jgi:hypothetical protein
MSSPCNGCKFSPDPPPAGASRSTWRSTCHYGFKLYAPLVRQHRGVDVVYLSRVDGSYCKNRDTNLEKTRFERILEDED